MLKIVRNLIQSRIMTSIITLALPVNQLNTKIICAIDTKVEITDWHWYRHNNV